jgi:RES domain-containing protein
MVNQISFHPESERLARGLNRCVAVLTSWTGVAYRSTSPRYANKDDLLTGVGSKANGARWNPPNSFRTIYASLDPHTALEEALAHFQYYGISMAQAMPRVIVSVRVELQRTLNLRDGKTRRLLGVSEKRILDEPWRNKQDNGQEALTQAIARLAYNKNWEGMFVPSAARRGGVNLVVFPANLKPPKSWLDIINREDLPTTS